MFHPKGPSFLELARQALSSTERGYDLLAPKFDYTPFRTPDIVIDAVLTQLSARDHDAIDVCCGTGAALARLRERVDGRVVGVDLSEGMLARAQKRLGADADDPRVALVRADALALPYRDCFDVAVSFGAFGHILRADEPRFLDSIKAALRSGGRFMFASASMPPLLHPSRLIAHGFNAAMRIRNAVWRPPFVMYYLTFMLPDCAALLARHGFDVSISDPQLAPPFERVRVVVARK